MKKIKLNTAKLKLTKERIATLSKSQMKNVIGGATGPCAPTPTPVFTLGKGDNFNCVDPTRPPTPTVDTSTCQWNSENSNLVCW